MTILNDSLHSFYTSLGDKSNARSYRKRKTLSKQMLDNLYQDNWLIGKFVDKAAEAMVKLPREIETTLDDSTLQTFQRIEKRLKTKQIREEAHKKSRLHGECLVFALMSKKMAETNKEDMLAQLDLEAEDIDRFILFEKGDYQPDGDVDDDPLSPNYGRPIYWLLNGKVKVHHSRVMLCYAKEVKAKGKSTYVSDVQGVYGALITHDTCTTNISDMLEESKVDVMKVQGFNEGIAKGRESDFAMAGEAMKRSKSSSNVLWTDATAEWQQKELTFAGLVEIWKQTNTELAGSFNMPLTLVFGQSAAGFATGEEDGRNWRDEVNNLQESRDRPLSDFIDQFIFDELKLDTTKFEWSYTYPSIEEQDLAKVSTALGAYSTAMVPLIQEGVINEAHAAKELKSLGLLLSIDDDHIKMLEEFIIEEIEARKNAKGKQEAEGADTEQAGSGLLP